MNNAGKMVKSFDHLFHQNVDGTVSWNMENGVSVTDTHPHIACSIYKYSTHNKVMT